MAKAKFEELSTIRSRIVYIFSLIYYLVIGVAAIVIAFVDLSDAKVALSILILLSSVPHFLIYLLDRHKLSYLIIGFVGLAFGILFLAVPAFDADQICMVWGCIDICRGLTEIINVAPTLKEDKREIIEILISIGDIVIGTLLIIHMSDGLQLHLMYLGIAFLLTAAKNVAELILEHKDEKKRINNN